MLYCWSNKCITSFHSACLFSALLGNWHNIQFYSSTEHLYRPEVHLSSAMQGDGMCFTDIKNNLTTSRTSSVKIPFTKIRQPSFPLLSTQVWNHLSKPQCSCKKKTTKKKRQLFKCVNILYRLLNMCKQKSKIDVNDFTKLLLLFFFNMPTIQRSVFGECHLHQPSVSLTLCMLCACQV